MTPVLALEWLEDKHTLHKSVEITYVVDGYMVTMMEQDGMFCVADFTAPTLLEAIALAAEKYPLRKATSKHQH